MRESPKQRIVRGCFVILDWGGGGGRDVSGFGRGILDREGLDLYIF